MHKLCRHTVSMNQQKPIADSKSIVPFICVHKLPLIQEYIHLRQHKLVFYKKLNRKKQYHCREGSSEVLKLITLLTTHTDILPIIQPLFLLQIYIFVCILSIQTHHCFIISRERTHLRNVNCVSLFLQNRGPFLLHTNTIEGFTFKGARPAFQYSSPFFVQTEIVLTIPTQPFLKVNPELN